MSSYNPVRPGDLITADFINTVLSGFDQRISNLEGSIGAAGGAMVIAGISPPGPVHMGDLITVVGQNFGLPSQVIVTIDGVTISGSSFQPGSGNSALIFQAPPVQGIPPLGQLVTMRVSNPTTSASFSFTLLPFVLTIPTGQLVLAMTGPPSVGTIAPGNSYTFIFTITGSTSLADVYNLAASLDAASRAAGWSAVTVDSSSGNPLSQIQIPQGQNTATTVGVKVTIPATAGVTTAQVTLNVMSVTNPTGLTGGGSTGVNVNAPPPPPNSIAITILAVTANLAGATFAQTGITLPRGTTSAVVALQATFPGSDTYTWTGPTFGVAGWAANIVKPTTKPFSATASPPTILQMQITAVPAGPATTTLNFEVNSTTQANIVGQITPSIAVS
jgi:hypothetical protein